MTLLRQARLANIRLALVGRTTSLPEPVAMSSTSSSKSARRDGWISLSRLSGCTNTEALTADVEHGFAADGLRSELDPLADVGVLVDGDFEPVQSKRVRVFHRGNLV